MSAIGTLEKIEIAEVLNEMVKRACLFEKVQVTTPSTTTTTTTAYRNTKTEAATANDNKEVAVEKEADRVFVQPVEAAYPNLVSLIINKKGIS